MMPVAIRRSRGCALLILASVSGFHAGCAEPPPERPRTTARPPLTRVAPVTDRLHGIPITDGFQWLESDSASEVVAWTDAQNRYTRTVLDALPGRAVLEARMAALTQVGSTTPPVVRGNRYFFATQPAGRTHPQIVMREGVLGADRVLVDPLIIDPSGATGVSWTSPAAGGTQLAYGTYREGDPASTLRVIDVDRASAPTIEIPHALPGVQWLPDGAGFVYQRLRDPKNPFSAEGVFHRHGAAIATDVVLFRQAAVRPDDPVASRTPRPFASLSRDGRWLLIGHWTDPLSNDLWVADFDAFRRTGRLVTSPVSRGERGIAHGTVVQGVIFLHTTKGSPNGRVLAAPVTTSSAPVWRTVVPERADAVIEAVAYGSGLVAVTYRIDAASVIEVFSSAGESRGRLALPAIGTANVVASDDRTEAYLSFTSFHLPLSIWRVDLATPTVSPKPWSTAGSPADASPVEVSQVLYRSRDGTRINMFLVHPPGLGRADVTPTLLSGYGGAGVNMLPAYSPEIVQWVEAGGLVAVPTLRGGGEYGQGWHAAGARENKQHAIDDLVAAAEWLVGSHYTNADHLTVSSDAHGALVAAAAVIQRPELFRAAVLTAPIVDMVRYSMFPLGAGMAPEYGDPRDPAAFRWLLDYSPFHKVRDGTRYPAMLVTALDPGAPIAPAHARKFVGALQRATTADLSQQPVLLRVDPAGGAGSTDPAAGQLRGVVDRRMFLLWQAGRLPEGTPANPKNR